jgi:hypothetical protein
VENCLTGETTTDFKHGDLKVSDANINFKIDVNDYFDAFVRINLLDGSRTDNGRGGINNAQFAWIRWKNLCNSGFGIVIGRDSLVFGAGGQSGFAEGQGYAGKDGFLIGKLKSATGGQFLGLVSTEYGMRTGYDYNRTTQITPYWESQDGKIKAEVSFFHNIEVADGGNFNKDGYHRSFNYGLGTMSGRLTVKPIEGLRLVASVMNRYSNGIDRSGTYYNYNVGPTGSTSKDARNSTAANFGFDYTPSCFSRLKLFAQWTHDWNAGWFDDAKADVTNFGFNFKLTEQLTFITQGEYLKAKAADGKISGWAVYPGFRYVLPYGVNFELAYRYERLTAKYAGVKMAKGSMSTVYGQIGFDF